MSQIEKIVVKTNRQLELAETYLHIVQRSRAMTWSRREVPLAIHKAVFDYNGQLLWPDGSTFVRPVCIFLEFGEPDNRWFSNFIKLDETGHPKFQSQLWHRIRLLDLFFQIRDSPAA